MCCSKGSKSSKSSKGSKSFKSSKGSKVKCFTHLRCLFHRFAVSKFRESVRIQNSKFKILNSLVYLQK